MTKEILLAQLKVLLDLPYTTAYQGNLGDIQTDSYVKYAEVLKRISQIRKELKTFGAQANLVEAPV